LTTSMSDPTVGAAHWQKLRCPAADVLSWRELLARCRGAFRTRAREIWFFRAIGQDRSRAARGAGRGHWLCNQLRIVRARSNFWARLRRRLPSRPARISILYQSLCPIPCNPCQSASTGSPKDIFGVSDRPGAVAFPIARAGRCRGSELTGSELIRSQINRPERMETSFRFFSASGAHSNAPTPYHLAYRFRRGPRHSPLPALP